MIDNSNSNSPKYLYAVNRYHATKGSKLIQYITLYVNLRSFQKAQARVSILSRPKKQLDFLNESKQVIWGGYG
jgi:hypothetical protein